MRVRPVIAHRGFRALAAAGLVMIAVGAGAHHLYLDRSGVPDLEPFIRFEPPTIGEVYGRPRRGAHRARARVSAHPRVRRDPARGARGDPGRRGQELLLPLRRSTTARSRAWCGRRWPLGLGLLAPLGGRAPLAASVIFPQGGSTLTQQLVRGYFLRHMTVQEDGGTLIGDGLLAAAASERARRPRDQQARRARSKRSASPSGSSEEMERRFGSRRRAKEEILARYASFIYMGNGRYGFAAASEYYFGEAARQLRAGRRGQGGAPRRHHQVAARLRARSRQHRAAAAAAQRHPRASWRATARCRGEMARRAQAVPLRLAGAQQDQDGSARRRRERVHRAEAARRDGVGVGSAHRRPHQRPDDRRQPHPAPGQRGAGGGPARLRARHPASRGHDPGLGRRAAQRRRGACWPRRAAARCTRTATPRTATTTASRTRAASRAR